MKETEIKVMNDDETRDFCIRKDYEIFKKEKEIERLNNIINELEKWVEEKFKIENTQYYYVIDANDLKRKIKELKGSE